MIKSTQTTTDGLVFSDFFFAFDIEVVRLGRNILRMYDKDDNEVFNSEKAYNFLFKGENARALIEDFIDHFYGNRQDDDEIIDAGLIFATEWRDDKWFYWSKEEILSNNYEFKNDAHCAIYEEGFFN